MMLATQPGKRAATKIRFPRPEARELDPDRSHRREARRARGAAIVCPARLGSSFHLYQGWISDIGTYDTDRVQRLGPHAEQSSVAIPFCQFCSRPKSMTVRYPNEVVKRRRDPYDANSAGTCGK